MRDFVTGAARLGYQPRSKIQPFEKAGRRFRRREGAVRFHLHQMKSFCRPHLVEHLNQSALECIPEIVRILLAILWMVYFPKDHVKAIGDLTTIKFNGPENFRLVGVDSADLHVSSPCIQAYRFGRDKPPSRAKIESSEQAGIVHLHPRQRGAALSGATAQTPAHLVCSVLGA